MKDYGRTFPNDAGDGKVFTSDADGKGGWEAGGSSLVRSARTSDTILAAADNGTMIDITGASTFTQTFTAAATLASGWYCYYRNSGTGDVTLDPNSGEHIDGIDSYIMYPGECRLIQCDGSGFNTIIISPFNKTFTGTGTFTKPPGYSVFEGLLWGAGGAAPCLEVTGLTMETYTYLCAGAGGACVPFVTPSADMGATADVTIGASSGGSSSLALTSRTITAYGGGSGVSGVLTTYLTAGGGALSAGNGHATAPTGGLPKGDDDSSYNDGFGGSQVFSGYGGSGATASLTTVYGSLYGGAGGRGVTLSSELVTTPDFSSGTGWTAGANWTIGSDVATAAAVGTGTLYTSITTTSGDYYIVQITVNSITAGDNLKMVVNTTTPTERTLTDAGTFLMIFLATAATHRITFSNPLGVGNTLACVIDNCFARPWSGIAAYAHHPTSPGGVSACGGNGGAACVDSTDNLSDGAAPGGGAGASIRGTANGLGGRGELRIKGVT
jgi:hypothetical protein